MEKDQRIRDSVHDLIVFKSSDSDDKIAWRLINAKEFQRLRRIKQLGFSEFVFPGATHTRFSHSIGTYHTARLLLNRIRQISGSIDRDKARTALIASLLHDVGHGPFSHVFEKVKKGVGIPEKHEDWSAQIIEGDTEIRQILEQEGGPPFVEAVSAIIKAKEPRDIYAAIVSSQFDADRLDYLRRDRYMTGTGLGAYDFVWLIDCLDIAKITTGSKVDFEEVDGLCLNHKGLQAAEGYLLARFHLYLQVYFHKTTRSAEQMLKALLSEASGKLQSKDWDACPVPSSHPIATFLSTQEPTLSDYLRIDDFAIWSALSFMEKSKDGYIEDLSKRLINRRLYKCFESSARAGKKRGDLLNRFKKKINELDGTRAGLMPGKSVLSDEASISAYSLYDFEERDALRQVLIRGIEGARPTDIALNSDIVKAIGKEIVERHYVPNEDGVQVLEQIWVEVAK